MIEIKDLKINKTYFVVIEDCCVSIQGNVTYIGEDEEFVRFKVGNAIIDASTDTICQIREPKLNSTRGASG